MRSKRYHFLIIREDGKQYHNRILEWFQLRRRLFWAGLFISFLILGTVGFFTLASWQGSLLVKTRSLRHDKKQLEANFQKLSHTLQDAQSALSKSEHKLAQMQELARQQNLKLPKLAGLGGEVPASGSPDRAARSSVKDPVVNHIASQIVDLKGETDSLSQETDSLVDILRPHLNQLAHRPSIWPVKGFIASGFGMRTDPIGGEPEFHAGLDIAANRGSPVEAPAEGIVIFAGWRRGFGKCIEISHGNGLSTLYGHLSKILVKPGQTVKRFMVIGRVGSTGYSTGYHLHYEVLKNGKPVNPKRYLSY
ncbi:MAG: M23 family metallopeptidase [Acidobacteriota bacterium]|jgi:murein DD-endopeptidase MepM/ murein hydrolase activator NlpD